MLRVVVRLVEVARFPVDEELTKSSSVLEPVVVHVDGFGAPLLDGVVGEAGARGVVDLDGGGRLGMPEFFERCSDRYRFSGCHVGSRDFGFCGGPHHISHDFANDMEGAVHGWWGGGGEFRIGETVREEEESRPSTARLRFG